MKCKPILTSLEDAIPLVIHKNNRVALLVYVDDVKHIRIGTVDTCVLVVSDPSSTDFKIQFQKNGTKFSNIINVGFVLLIRCSIVAVSEDEVVGIPIKKKKHHETYQP